MKRLSLVLKAVVLAALALGAMAPWIASAATGPWSWRDISGQLTEQSNRPVWAVAHSEDGWFYTDGQNLWNGGQVYRYDGSTQVNITNDVRNAGLDRADDIVTDGSGSVLFLQDVVRLDNQFRIISLQNGSYTNITTTIRNYLSSDEGISKLVGRNGTWYLVTTKGHLYRFTGSGSNMTQISLPAAAQNVVGTYSATVLKYNVNNGAPAEGTGRVILDLAPITNNNWLVVADPSNGPVSFYRYDGSSFTDITSIVGSNVERVLHLASNGVSALISEQDSNGSTTNRVSDGSTAANVSIGGNVQLTNAVIGYNGTSWMILNGKELYRLSGSYPSNVTADSYGRTSDLFLSFAGDTNGKFVLGGTISQQDLNDPTNPLTAKLVMIVEDGGISDSSNGTVSTSDNTITQGGTFGGDRVFTSTDGPRVTVQGNPSGFRVANGGEFAYRATASDSNGVDRIDVYVNDARIKTCKSNVCEYRTTYYLKNATTRTIKFWIRATDANGNSTDSSSNPDYLVVDANSSATANGTISTISNSSNNTTQSNTGTGINTWDWLTPNVSSMNAGDTATYGVGAWDANGINQIQIVVNGSVKQTCNFNSATGNQQCQATIYASDYSANTNVFVNAKVTDGSGNVSWTTGKNIYRNSGTSSTTTTNNGSTSVWDSLSPSVSSMNANDTVNYTANAQDSDGINRIDVYANGNSIQSCTFGSSTGNTQCTGIIYANSYAANTNVFVNAKVTDASGNVTWTTGKNIYRNGGSSTTNNSNNSTTSVWDSISPNVSSMNANDTVTYTANAQDNDGVSQIQIIANGTVKQTCNLSNSTSNVQCQATLYASDYAANTNVFVNAKVTDASGNVTWTTGKNIYRNGGSSNNTNSSIVVSLSPNQSTLGPNETIRFDAAVSDPDGIHEIDMRVNGMTSKTCWLNNLTSVTCSLDLHGSDYSDGKTLNLFVVAYDTNGGQTQSSTYTITRVANTTSSNGSNSNMSSWDWFDPNVTSMAQNGQITYHVGSWANAGLKDITVYVNGSTLPACTFNSATGNQECAKTIFASNYTVGTSIFVNARVRDMNNVETWTTGKSIAIVANGSTTQTTNTSNTSNVANASLSTWSDRDTTGYYATDSITVNATASDPQGVQRIELYMNGVRLQTCYGTSCTATTSLYSQYHSDNSYYAVVYDNNGNFTTSPMKTVYKR